MLLKATLSNLFLGTKEMMQSCLLVIYLHVISLAASSLSSGFECVRALGLALAGDVVCLGGGAVAQPEPEPEPAPARKPNRFALNQPEPAALKPAASNRFSMSAAQKIADKAVSAVSVATVPKPATGGGKVGVQPLGGLLGGLLGVLPLGGLLGGWVAAGWAAAGCVQPLTFLSEQAAAFAVCFFVLS